MRDCIVSTNALGGENDIPPPAEVIEFIELLTRRTGDGLFSASSLFDWALGPYATDLLLYPTACAAMPTNSRDRAGANVALLRLALLKWAFVRLQSRMEQRLAMFRPDVVEPCLTQDEALAQAPKAVDGRFAVPRILGEAE